MNQRGFFTIIGICFLLIVTICVKNIQESGKVYSYDAANFQAEQELQNLADSALVEAAEKISRQPELLPKSNPYDNPNNHQYQIPVEVSGQSDRLENFSVEVYGERGRIYEGTRKYTNGTPSDSIDKDANGKDIKANGIVLISIASCDSKIIGGKMYRRSYAYIFDDEEDIHYLTDD